MPREWRDQKPDADNLTKTVMDAMNGVAWRDDAQVCSLSATKVIATGDEQPHAEVTIEHATWTPPQPANETS
jgi:Holliday junction resolvase RusA-like endonuclease